MKRFVDNANPSYFVIDVPQRFFTIRRSAKGDLPDAQTGQGRRGGTIFTAGDMSKAEVVAVERYEGLLHLHVAFWHLLRFMRPKL